MSVVPVNQTNFNAEVVESKVPVVVDFFTTHCGPCKALAPVLERVSDQYEGVYKFVAINAEENVDLALHHGVRGVPTVLGMISGQEVARVVGYNGERGLDKILDAFNQGRQG